MSILDTDIQRVLRETSPAELAVMQDRDNWRARETAVWLVEHVLTDYTPSQVESMAHRLLDAVARGD